MAEQRGHDAVKDSHLKDLSKEWPVDARPDIEHNDERSNPTSGATGNDADTAAAAGINPQILRRPTRQPTDPIENLSLPVPVEVELDIGFQCVEPIPDLPHPSLDVFLKSEAFDDIRRLILDDVATNQQGAAQEVSEEVDNLFSAEEESASDVGEDQGLFAVNSLRFFLGNIRFDDAKTA